MLGVSSRIGFPLIVDDSVRDMPGFEPGPAMAGTQSLYQLSYKKQNLKSQDIGVSFGCRKTTYSYWVCQNCASKWLVSLLSAYVIKIWAEM